MGERLTVNGREVVQIPLEDYTSLLEYIYEDERRREENIACASKWRSDISRMESRLSRLTNSMKDARHTRSRRNPKA